MPEVFDDEVAVLLPPKHCAFKGCDWHLNWAAAGHDDDFERAREMQVVQHGMREHEHQIDAATKQFPRMHSRLEHVVAVNNEAIVRKVREGTT